MKVFQLIQTLYWLALATWFGGVLFIGIFAPIIFRTVRESNPTLPTVLSVNLENEHGSLLAGSIVASILRILSTIQLVCAAVVLATLICQWILMDRTRENITHASIRSVLFVIAVALVCYDRWFVWPKAWRYREEYIENADDPEIANAAKEQFDRYHHESVRVLSIIIAALSLMIAFSTVITAPSSIFHG
jgi:hypothetical protein